MTRIFLHVLQMSLTASFVILCVLAVRFLLKKSPKIFSYVLWAVVLFRLICPFAFESGFSIIPEQIDNAVTGFEVEHLGEISKTSFETKDVATVLLEDSEQKMDKSEMTEAHQLNANLNFDDKVVNEYSTEQSPEKATDFSIWFYVSLFSYIWLLGIVAMLFYSVFSLINLEERLAGAILMRDNIFACDGITSPFVIGVFRPKIYLPSGLPEKELDYIIMHEKFHIRRCDHIIKIFAFASLAIHWFNPLVWLAFIIASNDMEMSCDEAVLGKMGTGIRADYSASLLSLATGRKIISGSPLAFGEGDTKERIKNVLSFKRPKTWLVIASVVICIISLLLCIFNPHREKADLSIYGFDKKISQASDTNGLLTIVYYPEASEDEGIIKPMTIHSNSLIQYFETVEWIACGVPLEVLTSPGSIQISLDGTSVDIYNKQRVAKIKNVENVYYYKTGKNDFDKLLECMLSDNVYVSEKCLFMHPLSSFAAMGGDSGVRYIFQKEQITLENRNGAVNIIDGISKNGWEKLPWDASQWSELFVMSGTKPKMTQEFFDTARHRKLNDNYSLINYSGELWLVEFRENPQMGRYIWCVFSLIPEAQKGQALWEYAPYMSSRPPGFSFKFDFPYTEISAVSVDGRLLDFENNGTGYAEGAHLTYAQGHTLCWSPGNINENKQMQAMYASGAEVRFTVNNGEKNVAAGCIYIDKIEDRKGVGDVYQAKIVGTGLKIRQNSETHGAIISLETESTHTSSKTEDDSTYTLDSSLEDGENSLAKAIRAALQEHYRPNPPAGVMHKQAFEIIFSQSESSSPKSNDTNHMMTHTVGMLVVNRFYSFYSGTLEKNGGSNTPTVITFNVDNDGSYTLSDYWEPRVGTYYNEDIKSKFKGEALKYATTQSAQIYSQLEEKLKNEVIKELKASSAMTIMEEIELSLLKICSSPALSSNPGAYIEAHPKEYFRLLEYDEFTLRYCFGEFLKGEQTDLRGHIMAVACREILKNHEELIVSGEGFMTGQDWFDAYEAAVEELYSEMNLEDFEKLYRGAYILKLIKGAQ